MNTTHYGSAFPKRWRYYLSNGIGGTEEVDEPLEWRDVIFEFARNKESDGVVMMPSIPITFGGRGAEYIRRAVYAGLGAVGLRIEHLLVGGGTEVYFEGSLSTESFVDNVDSVDIQAEDASLENLVNSKAKVTYEIPFTAATKVSLPGLGVPLTLEAVNTDGVTRYKVPDNSQAAAVHDLALPVEIAKAGDPFFYDVSAPDVLTAKRAGTLTLTVTTNFRPTATVTPDPENANATGVSGGPVGGTPRLTLVVYSSDGATKSATDLGNNTTGLHTLYLDRNDLVTVEVRGASFPTTAPAQQQGDNYLNITWGKVNESKPLIQVTANATHTVSGRFACLTARDAFTALMRAIAPDMDFAVEYQAGLGLEDYALFTTAAVLGAESGVLKASFQDFRDFFALLGIGVAFDEKNGKPRCYAAFNTRTGQTGVLWPVSDAARIADVGDGWTDMALQFNEEALFGAIEIGWDAVKEYEVIPYLPDYCGKATYVNSQNSTSATKQLLSGWRADALGLADLLLQAELKGAEAVKGDDIWVLACAAGSGLTALAYPSDQADFYYRGLTYLYNLSLRPTALMSYVKPLLAVPLALTPTGEGAATRTYTRVSSSTAAPLKVQLKPDTGPVNADEPPTHLPVYAAFSSSVRANLWQIMRDPAKRYGWLGFRYRGVALKGFPRALKYNPTEESSQRCELYLTPDADLPGLIQ